MTTIQQALHIFRKDVREFRREAAVVFVLSAALVLLGVSTWEGIQEWSSRPAGDIGPLILLLPIAWCLLIARVIHAEALPGDRHFWLTRPYSRVGLLLSKAMFILVFINVPLLIAQAAILWLSGFPLLSFVSGLLWNQLLITALVLLPAATVAALTRNLAQFLPAGVLAAAVILPPFEESRIQPEWFGALLGVGVAGAIGGTILVLQYRRRQALRHAAITLGAGFIVILLYLAFPRSAAFAIQSTLIGGPDSTFSLQLGKTEEPPPVGTQNRYRQIVDLPLVPSGVAARNIEIESPQISFRTLSGVISRGATRTDGTRLTPQGEGFSQRVAVERNFFEAAKDSPVTVRGEYVVTLYGNEQPAEIPLDGSPVMIDGLGQCGTMPNYDRGMILCRSPFHSWKNFSSDRVAQNHDYRPNLLTLFSIHPLGVRRFGLIGEPGAEVAPQAPEKPLTLVVRDPVGFFRHQMEVPNVRLSQFAVLETRAD
jgi:hypothetical protein